ncbi:hypothetical protein [Breoghania sp.]|uniref:hypothetical protein n=1 Tax=Breoghania sp. TaxID=2065378 RepID=UPI002AA7C996|nr:hypothetical protein [Breoghania sp.]
MSKAKTPILAGIVAAMMIAPFALAQETTSPPDATPPAATSQSQPKIAPRGPQTSTAVRPGRNAQAPCDREARRERRRDGEGRGYGKRHERGEYGRRHGGRDYGERHEYREHHAGRLGWFKRMWDHDDDEGDDDDDDYRGRGRGMNRPAPSGSVTPPANGLFNNGAKPKAQVN